MQREATEKRFAEKEGDLKNIQLKEDCLEQYKRDMRKSLSASDTFITQSDLNANHEVAKQSAISKVFGISIKNLFVRRQDVLCILFCFSIGKV